jgi:hypothetical protein
VKKIAGSGSGFISQRHVCADPDPYQNFTGPQHCMCVVSRSTDLNIQSGRVGENNFMCWCLRQLSQSNFSCEALLCLEKFFFNDKCYKNHAAWILRFGLFFQWFN